MLLNVIVKYEKVFPVENNETVLIYKSFESDFVPRVNEYIKDSGFEGDLLIKKVEWVFENNLCNIQTSLVGSTRKVEEIKDQALAAGWKLMKM